MKHFDKIYEIFKQISSIPRCSQKEQKVLQYLKKWSENNWFDYNVDNIWNIIINVPSNNWSKDWYVLQAHQDMVCIKTKQSKHNFDKDPINILIKDDWLISDWWTTLWADNWIWIAIALYVAKYCKHPNLQLLFTVAEEVWLVWADNLDSSFIKYKRIINLDSEDFWEICIGSAGWLEVEISWNYLKSKEIFENNVYQIFVSWLKWWHSWVDIDKNRWNILFESVNFLNSYLDKFKLVNFKWWIASNAIPNEVEFVIYTKDIEHLSKKLDKFKNYLQNTFDTNKVLINIKKLTDKKFNVMADTFVNKLFNVILNIKNWVYKYSDYIPGLVKTSNNLWILNLINWDVQIVYMARSSDLLELDSIEKNIISKFSWIWLLAKTNNKFWGREENPNSDLVNNFLEIYKNYADVKLKSYHAWLECWVLVEKIWSWTQAISIWPTILNAHTVNEKCDIMSVEKITQILIDFLG